MKKAIPVIIAIVLIILIGGVYAGTKFLERYSYSKEYADLNEYYALNEEGRLRSSCRTSLWKKRRY